MCTALLAGDDPFARFVANGKKVIDACLEKDLARPGKIFVCGGSRGGYCALRLGAADPRINGIAGLAPVTDWRVLSEFSAVTERPEVAALALHHWAADLAGRSIWPLATTTTGSALTPVWHWLNVFLNWKIPPRKAFLASRSTWSIQSATLCRMSGGWKAVVFSCVCVMDESKCFYST